MNNARLAILKELAEKKGLILHIVGRSLYLNKEIGLDTFEVAHVRQTIGKSEAWAIDCIEHVLETY